MEENDAQIEPTPAVRRLHLLPRAVCRHRREPARHAAGGSRFARRGERAGEGLCPGQAASHRRPPSHCPAVLARRHGRDRPQGLPARELVGAEDDRGHGQGRRRDRDDVADHAAGDAARQDGGGPYRARGQRVRQEDDDRPSRPLRRVRHAAAAACRREPQRDRLFVRHAQGGRRRHHDELSGQVARPPLVRSGVAGAQSPQGHRVHASHDGELLLQPGAGRSRLHRRVRLRHDALHRQPDSFGDDEEISRISTGSGRTAAARSRRLPSVSWCR